MLSTDPCPVCKNPFRQCTCMCLKQLCCGAALYDYTHEGKVYHEGHFDDCPGYRPGMFNLPEGTTLTVTVRRNDD